MGTELPEKAGELGAAKGTRAQGTSETRTRQRNRASHNSSRVRVDFGTRRIGQDGRQPHQVRTLIDLNRQANLLSYNLFIKRRIRDKYESELKEVEKTERETMERFNSLKAKYNELEGEYERLKVVCKQKERDLEGIKKLTDILQDERNRLADVIRQDFSDRLIFTEEENKRIKLEMVEFKSRHQYELDKRKEEFEKLQREKSEELDTVHEK